jgi:hypothetical protein
MLKKKRIANMVAQNAQYDKAVEEMLQRSYYVYCNSCKDRHNVKSVEFLNVEEDIQGRDVAEYNCPGSNTIQRSYVVSV